MKNINENQYPIVGLVHFPKSLLAYHADICSTSLEELSNLKRGA
jgi:hypothetical protein